MNEFERKNIIVKGRTEEEYSMTTEIVNSTPDWQFMPSSYLKQELPHMKVEELEFDYQSVLKLKIVTLDVQ